MGASNQPQQSQTNILQGLSPQLQQLIGQWMSTYAPALAGELGYQQQMQPQYAQDTAGIANQLANFKGLQPQEVSELTQQAGNAVKSAASTFAAQSGGVANPALLEKQLAGQAGQTAGDVATNLGSIASQQKLSGLQSAGGLYSGLSGQSLDAILASLGLGQSAMNTGVQGSLGVGQQYGQQQQSNNQAKGQEWQGVGSLLGGAGSLYGSGIFGSPNTQTTQTNAPQYSGGYQVA
jgi:hypothetical protein